MLLRNGPAVCGGGGGCKNGTGIENGGGGAVSEARVGKCSCRKNGLTGCWVGAGGSLRRMKATASRGARPSRSQRSECPDPEFSLSLEDCHQGFYFRPVSVRPVSSSWSSDWLPLACHAHSQSIDSQRNRQTRKNSGPGRREAAGSTSNLRPIRSRKSHLGEGRAGAGHMAQISDPDHKFRNSDERRQPNNRVH